MFAKLTAKNKKANLVLLKICQAIKSVNIESIKEAKYDIKNMKEDIKRFLPKNYVDIKQNELFELANKLFKNKMSIILKEMKIIKEKILLNNNNNTNQKTAPKKKKSSSVEIPDISKVSNLISSVDIEKITKEIEEQKEEEHVNTTVVPSSNVLNTNTTNIINNFQNPNSRNIETNTKLRKVNSANFSKLRLNSNAKINTKTNPNINDIKDYLKKPIDKPPKLVINNTNNNKTILVTELNNKIQNDEWVSLFKEDIKKFKAEQKQKKYAIQNKRIQIKEILDNQIKDKKNFEKSLILENKKLEELINNEKRMKEEKAGKTEINKKQEKKLIEKELFIFNLNKAKELRVKKNEEAENQKKMQEKFANQAIKVVEENKIKIFKDREIRKNIQKENINVRMMNINMNNVNSSNLNSKSKNRIPTAPKIENFNNANKSRNNLITHSNNTNTNNLVVDSKEEDGINLQSGILSFINKTHENLNQSKLYKLKIDKQNKFKEDLKKQIEDKQNEKAEFKKVNNYYHNLALRSSYEDKVLKTEIRNKSKQKMEEYKKQLDIQKKEKEKYKVYMTEDEKKYNKFGLN